MAISYQLRTLVLVLSLSLVCAVYSPWAHWILTSQYLNNVEIKDSMNTAPNIKSVSGTIDNTVSVCGYTQLDPSKNIELKADFTSFIAQSPDEFAVSIWIYFTSTSGSTPFKFTDNAGTTINYEGGFTTEGSINFSFTDDSNSHDSSKDSLLTVNSGKLYIGKWLFFTFYWVNVGSDVTWNIILPSIATVEKKAGGYIMPKGYFLFGAATSGKIYDVQVFKSVTRTTSTDLAITLVDYKGGTYAATTATCPSTCYTYCDPSYGCFSDSTCQCPLINNCDSNGTPISCKDPNADFSNSCQCKIGYKLQGSSCIKGILHIDCPLNCAECSSSTVCTQCNPTYYLHDISGGTECVCNFYVACTAFCNSCEPDASCYECATSVIKDEGNCRSDSVGFQVSFSFPFVVLNFAHPLDRILTVRNLVAKTADGTSISTSDWTIDPSTTLSQLKVKTSLTQSQLPISLNLKFGKI